MTDNTVAYSIQELVEIVASILECIDANQCFEFTKQLFDRLSYLNHPITEFIGDPAKKNKIPKNPNSYTDNLLDTPSNPPSLSQDLIMKIDITPKANESVSYDIDPSLREEQLQSSNVDKVHRECSDSHRDQQRSSSEHNTELDSYSSNIVSSYSEGIQLSEGPNNGKELIEGLGDKLQLSFVHVVLRCFAYFEELTMLIPQVHSNSVFINSLKSVVSRLTTSNDISKEFDQFFDSMKELGYPFSTENNPGSLYYFILVQLSRNLSQDELIKVCFLVRTENYVFTTEPLHYYLIDCNPDPCWISYLKNDLQSSGCRRHIYPKILAIRFTKITPVNLGTKLSITDYGTGIVTKTYQAETIISKEGDDYSITTIKHGSFIQYKNRQAFGLSISPCMAYIVFLRLVL